MKLILFCAVDAEKLEKYLPSAIFIYMMTAMEAWQSGLMHRS